MLVQELLPNKYYWFINDHGQSGSVRKRVIHGDQTSEAAKEHAHHIHIVERKKLPRVATYLYIHQQKRSSLHYLLYLQVQPLQPKPLQFIQILSTQAMDFLSDLQKKANSSSGTHHPEKHEQHQNQNQHQHQHHKPSNSELMASAKYLAEAAQSTFSHESDKLDKARVAAAAGDVLAAASSYGKLEEKSFGKYVEQAETYLHQYGHSSSQSHSTTTTTTSSHSSHSTTTHSKPHSAGGGHESEGHSESGYGDYFKMAQGFLKK